MIQTPDIQTPAAMIRFAGFFGILTD